MNLATISNADLLTRTDTTDSLQATAFDKQKESKNTNNHFQIFTQKLRVKLVNFAKNLRQFLNWIYNRKTHEVIGRDGLSWAKISFFYFLFFGILAGINLLFVHIFFLTVSGTVPTYIPANSVMAYAKNEITGEKRLNPGLGFRPQIDIEEYLITYSTTEQTEAARLVKQLNGFLHKNQDRSGQGINCASLSPKELAEKRLKGFYCEYNATEVLESTPCSEQNMFNYFVNDTENYGPCVVLKVNKIFNWIPQAYSVDSLPQAINISGISNATIDHVFIKCVGERGADMDALERTNLVYYSPVSGGDGLRTTEVGHVPFFYYPYRNEIGYRQPLVFVHFKRVPRNRLINVLCRAYAANIDSEDYVNMRGMTRFKLFVKS